MKFLQLKAALEAAFPREEPPPRPEPKPELQAIQFYNPDWKKQTVVGSNLLRTPIDRTAALVVSKAPWWAMPPQVSGPTPPKPLTPDTYKPVIKPKKGQSMSMSSTVQKINNPAQAPGTVEEKKPNDVLNAELASEFVKRSTDAIHGIKALVDQAMDARAALDILCDYWKPEWVEFMKQSDERLKTIRMTRMAFEVETKILMASLKDVRAFFLDQNHDAEVARLREFVDLCERLQKLKQSGFLDTVADTLLRLA